MRKYLALAFLISIVLISFFIVFFVKDLFKMYKIEKIEVTETKEIINFKNKEFNLSLNKDMKNPEKATIYYKDGSKESILIDTNNRIFDYIDDIGLATQFYMYSY